MFRRLLSWIIPSCPSETRCARFQLYIRRLSWWNDVHIGDIPRLQYSFAGVTTTWSHVIPDRPANKYKEKRGELGEYVHYPKPGTFRWREDGWIHRVVRLRVESCGNFGTGYPEVRVVYFLRLDAATGDA